MHITSPRLSEVPRRGIWAERAQRSEPDSRVFDEPSACEGTERSGVRLSFPKIILPPWFFLSLSGQQEKILAEQSEPFNLCYTGLRSNLVPVFNPPGCRLNEGGRVNYFCLLLTILRGGNDKFWRTGGDTRSCRRQFARKGCNPWSLISACYPTRTERSGVRAQRGRSERSERRSP